MNRLLPFFIWFFLFYFLFYFPLNHISIILSIDLSRRYYIKKDLEKARQLYEKAALRGNKEAQFHLGYLYEKGGGVRQDWREAINLYTLSSHQGYGKAKTRLGILYRDGLTGGDFVLSPHLPTALHLFKEGASQGDMYSLFHLALFYEEGREVEKNITEAARLYTLARAHGFQPADAALHRLRVDHKSLTL
jgi:hypothetical protein